MFYDEIAEHTVEVRNFDPRADCDELSSLIRRYLVVSVKKARLSPPCFYSVCRKMGEIYDFEFNAKIERSAKSYFLRPLYKKKFSRAPLVGMNYVSGERDVLGRLKGLQPGLINQLGWHCNEWVSDKHWPTVALYGVSGTGSSITQVISSVRFYRELSEDKKKYLQSLSCVWDENSVDYEGLDESVQMQYSERNKQKCSKKLKKIFQRSKPIVRSLVAMTSAGHQGLHFSPMQVSGIVGMTHRDFLSFRNWFISKLLDNYKNHAINHKWNDGDILFMDQKVSLHRRVKESGSLIFTDQELKKRKLLRLEMEVFAK